MNTKSSLQPGRGRKALGGFLVLLPVIVMVALIQGCGPREESRPVREAIQQNVKNKPTATPIPSVNDAPTQAEQTQQQAQEMLHQILDEQHRTLAAAEAQRQAKLAQHAEGERRREEQEAERIAGDKRLEKQRRTREENLRREEEILRQEQLEAKRVKEERARREAELEAQREADEAARLAAAATAITTKEDADEVWDDIEDDTPDIQTESTVSMGLQKKGWKISGDLRPILDALYEESRDGTTEFDGAPGIRARIGADFGITKRISVGTRIAGTGFLGNFNPNFILPGSNPEGSDLESGTFGFDQLYFRWQRKDRFSLAVGRLQTRFQLRGGVYAKSLDRNNSHNWRVNWTDGLQATLKAGGWNSSFVLQYNKPSGPTGVRRDPLDFEDDGARLTTFLAFENFERKGVLVQRAFDISYLPASLLKDGTPDGRRTDYWGFVGRLMFVWPPEKKGLRFRGGIEAGYAPETPTYQAQNLPGVGDTNGFAWNIVASAMDFKPGHSIGLNYARTQAGWLLSPQYRPNHELIELRHMWRSKKFPLLETRIRRRTELDQQIGTVRPRTQYDFFVRATIRFTLLEQ